MNNNLTYEDLVHEREVMEARFSAALHVIDTLMEKIVVRRPKENPIPMPDGPIPVLTDNGKYSSSRPSKQARTTGTGRNENAVVKPRRSLPSTTSSFKEKITKEIATLDMPFTIDELSLALKAAGVEHDRNNVSSAISNMVRSRELRKDDKKHGRAAYKLGSLWNSSKKWRAYGVKMSHGEATTLAATEGRATSPVMGAVVPTGKHRPATSPNRTRRSVEPSEKELAYREFSDSVQEAAVKA